ncbi:MAG: folate-dependent phosphoribosylglycinamide formyltransferase PurN [Crocinitomix sp.]|jgi:folate-dependent phosphoribosylglycinamide formyltransferase PurN
MQKANVVVIASEGLTTNLLVERLSTHMNVCKIFIESSESKKTILKRRMKRLGFSKTAGQVLFLILALPFVKNRKNRIAAIIKQHKLSGAKLDDQFAQRIKTVNDPALVSQIEKENPTLIFINGTRILNKILLDKINCPIVNIHVGITPKYRGVHGGYWAVHNKDLAHFGVTLHLVDQGIDTGHVIAQKIITPEKEDNFKTYPLLQYCTGLDLISTNYEKLLGSEIKTIQPLTTESKLHYHPTLWEFWFGKR